MDTEEHKMKISRDLKAVIDTADMNGEIRGIAKVAKTMKNNGFAVDIIIANTGLTEEQINSL